MAYIGYATLEGWAGDLDGGHPVYVMLVREMGTINPECNVIYCAQVNDRDVVYWKKTVANLQMVNGEPFSTDSKERIAAAIRAYEIVKSWIEAQGFVVREGMVAFPKDFRFLEGETNIMRYDKESKTFVETAKD